VWGKAYLDSDGRDLAPPAPYHFCPFCGDLGCYSSFSEIPEFWPSPCVLQTSLSQCGFFEIGKGRDEMAKECEEEKKRVHIGM
jgi:hypothetical protein